MEKKRKRKKRPTKAQLHRKFLNTQRHKYDAILAAQGGHCALCPRKPTLTRKLDLDHHHGEMRVRGLLCVICNRALREFMDREWLLKAADYVENDWGVE